MADNLIFPIGFDLNKAVSDASKEWDDTYSAKLENALAKKPISAKLKLDTKNLDSLDAVKKRLAELKIEPITPETKSAINELAKELNQLAKALETLQKYSKNPTKGAVDTRKVQLIEERAKAQAALAAQRAAKAEDYLASARLKAAKAANVGASATQNASNHFSAQKILLSNLITKMSAYWSIRQVGNFLTDVRNVTAEFELQRVSLGAILQDQSRANILFSEIKSFALKSPVKILDLTKYTKQLAAYKIGYDELFETTKKLTDVSVGLGVSMDRVVLAYGQVRATGHLRASEVRQFTEMGVPIVEELAAKLSKMNGEMVTSAQVMDMISNRAISFDMVKEVFDDMTSAGGIFYNMQEKQGNTIYGMWQKLGDAASVMYEQIGNTESVNNAMKSIIDTLRYLMIHWKQVGIVIGVVSVAIAKNIIAHKNLALARLSSSSANQKNIASMMQEVAMLRVQQANLRGASIAQRANIATTIAATKANISAATATNVFSRSLYAMKAALLSNPWTALIVALTTIISLIITSESELDKLDSKLQEIDRNYAESGKKSVEKFKELAEAATENIDGSKAQKDALDELNRTYGQILGSEALELESLKSLKGEYGELINIIDAYNIKKRGEEKSAAIKSAYSTSISEELDDLKDYLNAYGFSSVQQSEFIEVINEEILKGKNYIDATNAAFTKFADNFSELRGIVNMCNIFDIGKSIDAFGVGLRGIGGYFGGEGRAYVYNYAEALEKQNDELDRNDAETKKSIKGLNQYNDAIDNLSRSLGSLDWSSLEALNKTLKDYNSQHPENRILFPVGFEPVFREPSTDDIEKVLGGRIDEVLRDVNSKNLGTIVLPVEFGFDPSKAETEYEKLLETSNLKIATIFSVLKGIAEKEGVEIPKAFYHQAKSVVDGNTEFSFIDFDGIKNIFKSAEAKSALSAAKSFYENLAPSTPTERAYKARLGQIIDYFGADMDKLSRYFIKSGENLKDYRKRLKDSVDDLTDEMKSLLKVKMLYRLFGWSTKQVEEEYERIGLEVKVLNKLLGEMPSFGTGRSAGKQDQRLSVLQEMASTLQKINKEYDDLSKKEGPTNALSDINKMYKGTLDNLNALSKKYKFKLPTFTAPTDTISIKKYLGDIRNVMKKLPKHDKAVLSLEYEIAKIDKDEAQNRIERELKDLSDKISRTKTAKDFYDNIFKLTGDVELAANVTIDVFGDTGTDVQSQMIAYIQKLFGKVSFELPLSFISDGSIDYKGMERFVLKYVNELGGIESEVYKNLLKIARDGQSSLAKSYEGYLKDLQVAKTYSDKRIELARYTSSMITEIENRTDLSRAEKDRLIAGYKERELREAARLEYEAFKDTPMYTKMFEDLEHASDSSLRRLRDRLIELKSQWKNLDPTQIKELQKDLDKLNDTLTSHSPFASLIKALKDYRKLIKSGRTRETDEANADAAERKRQDAEYTMMINERLYEDAVKLYGVDSEIAKTRRRIADESKAAYDLSEKNANVTTKQAGEWDNIGGRIQKALSELKKYVEIIEDAFSDIHGIMETLGSSEIDLQFFDDITNGFSKVTSGAIKAGEAALNIMSGNPLMIAQGVADGISAIGSFVSGFTDLLYAGRVRRANKEINRQKDLIEKLEYTYSRLEKATENAFGTDFLKNYNDRLQNLMAQRAAELKKAEAERSKGKKKDNEKVKEYEDNARDLLDSVTDMQDEFFEKLLGTKVSSAAEDFANAWLEAYLSFEDTSEAITEKFNDMMKNMVVNMALAGVVERILQPFFKKVEGYAKDGKLTDRELSEISAMIPQYIGSTVDALDVAMDGLKAAGFDLESLRTGASDMKGISRDIASASEESINGLAAGINTQNFYISQIHSNVALIAQYMLNGNSIIVGGSGASVQDLVSMQNTYLSQLPVISSNTSELILKCERAAAACESMALTLSRVVKPSGVRASHLLNTVQY